MDRNHHRAGWPRAVFDRRIVIMGQLYRLDFSNGKSYVGITINSAAKRYRRHAWRAANESARAHLPVYLAWRKYGAPELIILADSDDWNELCTMETLAIFLHNTYVPNGYNRTYGGEGAVALRHNESTRNKHRLAKMGNTYNKGNKYSVEVRARIAETSKGRVPWNKGKKASEETIEKQRIARIGFKHSPASIEKMRLVSASRQITTETRKKMVATRQANRLAKRNIKQTGALE